MKVLWIPIFSMRSYDTGEYAICKDGNFQLTFARVIASDFDSIVIAIPEGAQDLEMFLEQNGHLIEDRDIEFVMLKYGANAVDTRRKFWELNKDYFYSEDILEYDLLITDITGYAGTMSYDIPFINNFNITKLPQLDRPYIDEFFEMDLKSIEASIFTTVINPCQRDYIIKVRPDLASKVIVDTKVAHHKLMPLNHKTRALTPQRTIFWPFRISDKAYRFDAFLEMFEREKLYHKYELLITDPNDSYKGDSKHVKKIKPTKAEYYKILQDTPIVVMLDDIDTVLHPGTIEIMYYGCAVITLPNELVNNPLQVESIDHIPQVLADLGYNNRTDVRDFAYVYSDEVSTIYCKEHVSKCVPNF